MKHLMIGLAALCVLTISSVASAAPLLPCSDAMAAGTKCHINGVSHYSCGGGAYVNASYGAGACNSSWIVDDSGRRLRTKATSERLR